jgi:nitroreductase
MTLIDLMRARRSVRAYLPDPVGDDDLAAVLEAARLAPSARNLQPTTFIVVREPANRAALQAAYEREWFWTAPVVIAACVDRTACWKRRQDGRSSADIDAAIALDHLVLAAWERGLGTCWVCAFDPVPARRLLALPEHIELVAMTPLGRPATLEGQGNPERKPLAAVVRYERW